MTSLCPADDLAVDRDFLAGPDDDVIAADDVLQRHSPLDAVALDLREPGRQVEQRPDGLARALERPHLQPLCHGEEKDDRRRLEALAEHESAADGDHHQAVDVDRSRPERQQSSPRREHAPGERGDHETNAGRQCGMAERRAAQVRRRFADAAARHEEQSSADVGA